MIDLIKEIDQNAVLAINEWHTVALDWIMWQMSGKLQWLPLYVYLLWLLYKKYKLKIWLPLLAVVITITLCDQISVHWFKELFERYRPCHNLELKPFLELVNNKCGGKYGFVSSHAANSFGLAVLLCLFLKGRILVIGLLIWASLVSFSRVYLAVHYPSDVIAGAILGALIAFINYRFFKSFLLK